MHFLFFEFHPQVAGYFLPDFCNEAPTMSIPKLSMLFQSLFFLCPLIGHSNQGFAMNPYFHQNDTLRLDTIAIVEDDDKYYSPEAITLSSADGGRTHTDTVFRFKDANATAYYRIADKKNGRIKFEGAILKGNRYHGRIVWYFVHDSRPFAVGKVEHYLDEVKHGQEVMYDRDGKVLWQKLWKNGKQVDQR
jgi:hypothetical protein